ncbi:alpha/beta fold hydrolase [Mesorhizobium sp. A623]
MRYLTTDDNIVLNYNIYGNGPPLVFAHESSGSSESWRAQVEYFSRWYTCIVYDARGYPPSVAALNPEAYSQDIFVDDMKAVFDQCGIENAHLVGLSMGSMTALHFAIRFPHRIRTLVLAGTGPGESARTVSQFNARTKQFADFVDANDWANILANYDSASDRRNLLWKNPKLHELRRSTMMSFDKRIFASILRKVVADRPILTEMVSDLRRAGFPVLIMTGDQDEDCLPTSQFLRNTFNSADLAIFPGTGHAVNAEEPHLFNQIVGDFFLKHSGWVQGLVGDTIRDSNL